MHLNPGLSVQILRVNMVNCCHSPLFSEYVPMSLRQSFQNHDVVSLNLPPG